MIIVFCIYDETICTTRLLVEIIFDKLANAVFPMKKLYSSTVKLLNIWLIATFMSRISRQTT